jgi:hypothetical protein
MITNKITFIPPLKQDDHGWLDIDGDIIRITNIHNFDDFGVEQDTLTLEDGREFFTQDGGNTFREDWD